MGVDDIRETSRRASPRVRAAPCRAQEQQPHTVVIGVDEFTTQPQVVAGDDGLAAGDDATVEVASAQPNIVAGVLEVVVPPLQVDCHPVVEHLQVVHAETTPLGAGFRWLEPFVVGMHAGQPATRMSLPPVMTREA